MKTLKGATIFVIHQDGEREQHLVVGNDERITEKYRELQDFLGHESKITIDYLS